jgi:hypothetical protein
MFVGKLLDRRAGKRHDLAEPRSHRCENREPGIGIELLTA